MKKHKNQGSASIWVLMILFVATILLLCILPMTMASITNSKQSNYNQQAYYTAKSVTDMIAEYIASSTESGVGAQIMKKVNSAAD